MTCRSNPAVYALPASVLFFVCYTLYSANYGRIDLSLMGGWIVKEMKTTTRDEYGPLHADIKMLKAKNVSGLRCLRTVTKPPFVACILNTTISTESRRVVSDRSMIHSSEYQVWLHMARAWRFYPNSTFIDGGANIGFYTTLAAAMGLNVIAFEPTTYIARCIQKNMFMNNLQNNIILLNNALSNVRTTVFLQPSAFYLGSTRVLKRKENRLNAVGVSRTVFLDDVLPLIKTNVVILKLDIQGYECKALDKAKKLLSRLFVPYIFVEWNELTRDKNAKDTACDAKFLKRTIAYLRQLEYSPFRYGNSDMVVEPDRLASSPNFINMFWQHKKAIVLE